MAEQFRVERGADDAMATGAMMVIPQFAFHFAAEVTDVFEQLVGDVFRVVKMFVAEVDLVAGNLPVTQPALAPPHLVKLKVRAVGRIADAAGPHLFADVLIASKNSTACEAGTIAVNTLRFIDRSPAAVGELASFVPIDLPPLPVVEDLFAVRLFNEMIFHEKVVDRFVGDEMFDADATAFARPADRRIPCTTRPICTLRQPHARRFVAEDAM